jgi:hypothetical protein
MTHSSLPSFKDFFQLFMPRKDSIKRIRKNWGIEGKDGVILLSRSAWSMALITLLRQQKESRREILFWAPSYFCSSSLDIVRLTGCKIVYYPVTAQMEPDFSVCREIAKTIGGADIFLLVHYFGKPNTALGKSADFSKNYGAWLVEDAAHVLQPVKGMGDFGDFILYSPHKLLPVPDGAILAGNCKGPSSLDADFFSQQLTVENALLLFKTLASCIPGYFDKPHSLNQIKWVFKRTIQAVGFRIFSKSHFFQKSEDDTLYTFSPLISSFSLSLLSKYNKQRLCQIALKREANNLLWDSIVQQLSSSGKIKLNVLERPSYNNWCPYIGTYQVEMADAESAFGLLNNKDFYVTTWPDLPSEVIQNPDQYRTTINLRNSRVYLPVHQSVSQRHLGKLIRKAYSLNGEDKLSILQVQTSEADQLSWQELKKASKQPISMLQDWQYGTAKQDNEDWRVCRRIYSFEGKPVAIAQLLVKRFFCVVKLYRLNQGPIFFTEDKKIVEAVIGHIAALGNILKFSLVVASFNLERNAVNVALLKRYGFITLRELPYTSSRINLSKTEQSLRSSLTSKWRNMLVYAEKRNMDIVASFDEESIEWISKMHEKNMSEKKFQGINPSLLKAYAIKENAGVYKAILDGKVIGAICIAFHGNTCTYLIGWTNDAGRYNKANYLLLWRAILDSKLRGFLFFDTGGIDRFSTEGIANFKSGLGGQLFTLTPVSVKI